MLKPKSKQLHRPFDENGTLEGSPKTKLVILLRRNASFALTMLVLHLGDPGWVCRPGGVELGFIKNKELDFNGDFGAKSRTPETA